MMTVAASDPPAGLSSRTSGPHAPHASGTHGPATARSPLPWPVLPGMMPFWFAWIAWSWWDETNEIVLRMQPGDSHDGSGVIALVSLAARLTATLCEAGFYALWWRARGTPLRYWRFFAWIVTLSLCDLIASALREAAPGAPRVALPLFAVLAGSALEPPAASGFVMAFGSVGLLTLARVATTGWVAARGTGRSFPGPALVVTTAWLLTRLAAWWSFDLVRGVSPLR